MSRLIVVVENTRTLPVHIGGVEVVSARRYLTDPRFVEMKRAKVFNLCRSFAYQTLGYYVSLLAEARAHRHLPALSTITELRQAAVVRLVSDELEGLIDKSLASLRSDQFELSIYFGRNLAGRYDRLCQALFSHFPAPLLRARFSRGPVKVGGPKASSGADARHKAGPKGGGAEWKLTDLRLISLSDVPESHHEFLLARAAKYFERPRDKSRVDYRYDLAILTNPDEADAPSDDKALARFERAARKVGLRPFFIGKEEYPRIAEYDALFIRETTGVNHHTYRFARRAEREGLVVIDDPTSILRCCNKVYQAEVFEKQGIPCPRTMIVHAGNRADVAEVLGLPCVLKRPDSSFSQGVEKARTQQELDACLDRFLEDSELVVAQSFVTSQFDWRVGVLGGRALYVCRYFMARGHWQIQKTGEGGQRAFGKHETLAVEDAPPEVLGVALAAARSVGSGLYGVDIKESEGGLYVMEVNDNPSIDGGVEDQILKDELYLSVMRHLVARLDEKGRAR